MRSSVLPTVLVLVLLGLVILLPKRDGEIPEGSGAFVLPGATAAGTDVALALLDLPPLECNEPPPWAAHRGRDALQRHLDRLAWGRHPAIVRAREALAARRGTLAPAILERLEAIGESDPILAAKLVALLGDEGEAPGVVEELVRRALSPSALVAKAALKALAFHPSSSALGGILPRRDDGDLEVRAQARAALAERARRGDVEARHYLLDELARTATDPDLAYLTVLGEIEPDGEVLAVLRRVEEVGHHQARLAALAALVVHGEQEAIERVEAMLADGDAATRQNAARIVALSGRVLGVHVWRHVVLERRVRPEVLPVMSAMERAVAEGHEAAPRVYELLEAMAADPTHPCQVEALDMLLGFGHPWAVERTRMEVQHAVGAYLGQTVDRIIRYGGRTAGDYAELALTRLEEDDLEQADQALLCRLLAYVAPETGADVLVDYAMDGPPLVASNVLTYLPVVGQPALDRLERELDTSRGVGLYVFVASTLGEAEALPRLEEIASDRERDLGLRTAALEGIVRLREGEREEALRRVAESAEDPQLTERARLLFWNYL